MRPNQQNKNRSRGRNSGRKNVNPLSRNFESNGPDVKIRGNAAHIAERYVQLARDATASGDSVTAENYLQHAEHYFRILSAAQAQMQPRKDPNLDYDEDDDSDESNATSESSAPASAKSEAQPESQGDAAQTEAASEGDAGKERTRSRRPRRRRSGEDEASSNDPASAPQPDVGELPAFLTGGNTANAAE